MIDSCPVLDKSLTSISSAIWTYLTSFEYRLTDGEYLTAGIDLLYMRTLNPDRAAGSEDNNVLRVANLIPSLSHCFDGSINKGFGDAAQAYFSNMALLRSESLPQEQSTTCLTYQKYLYRFCSCSTFGSVYSAKGSIKHLSK